MEERRCSGGLNECVGALLSSGSPFPVVVRSLPSSTALWPALASTRRWTDRLLERSRGLELADAFHSATRFFGPYWNSDRPNAALLGAARGHAYETGRVIVIDDLLRGAQDDGYWYWSGRVEDVPEAVPDVSPFNEMIAFNPRKTSVNLWLAGKPGVTTPCHYDGFLNLFTQLEGRKEFVLVSPEESRAMQVFPLLSPGHAQCQPNFTSSEALDDRRWPRARAATKYRVVLEPGDTLVIPPLWFHHVTGLTAPNAGLNVWTSPPEEDVAEALARVVVTPVGKSKPGRVAAAVAFLEASLGSRQAFHRLLSEEVYAARYRAVMPLFQCGVRGADLVPGRAAVDALADKVAAAASQAAALIARLPRQTRGLWLGNHIERTFLWAVQDSSTVACVIERMSVVTE